MSTSFELVYKSTVVSGKKFLKITPDFIELADNNSINVISMSKLEISDMRYGIKAIRGYRFTIGRIYCIDIRNISGKVIKIRLKSLYRINVKSLSEKYIKIVNAVYENFINDLCRSYIETFYKKIDFDFNGIKFKSEGIQFDKIPK